MASKLCLLGSEYHQQFVLADSMRVSQIIGIEQLQEQMSDWLLNDEAVCLITNLPEALVVSVLETELVTSPAKIESINISSPELEIWLKLAGIDARFGEPCFGNSNHNADNLYSVFTRYIGCAIELNACLQSAEDNSHQHELSCDVSESVVRLYPTGERQDTLVFCQRFYGLHYASILSKGTLPQGEPIQDPRLLRYLRESLSKQISKVTVPGFCKVTCHKDVDLLDIPKGYSKWLSINQLKALLRHYDESYFELTDVWVFKEHKSIENEFITEQSNWLSVTFGVALSIEATQKPVNTWTRLFIACEEKAFWLNLIHDVLSRFEVTVSGYGSGALSFYCWNGELERVCNFIRQRAAVLKHWDKQVEANIQEIIHGLEVIGFESESTDLTNDTLNQPISVR
ncbi:hypothetical protein HB762_26305 (plasmid) [Vibrio campbellii]|uniref:Uncharacterized protein n=1 Tax=Vibrio campbellii TaxID=680 RepID=A0ABY5ILZ7_9VIBR|nr:hypothetical protein [Vibrio campbellii]UTZ34776.1 hypothetical protein HB762_26305 [Vibrio campbellii]